MKNNNIIEIFFPNTNSVIKIKDDATVADACAAAGFPLDLVCGGNGKCGKCKVDIGRAGEIETVLACKTIVTDGMKVYMEGKSNNYQILETTAKQDLIVDSATKCIYIEKSKLKTEFCRNDWDHIKEFIPFDISTPSLNLLKKLSRLYHLNDIEGINVIIYKEKVLDFVVSEREKDIYGIAFDMGTTSVVGYLYDLSTGKKIDASSQLNEQASFGGDVISRIQHSMESQDNLLELQTAGLKTINTIINNLLEGNKIDFKDVYHVTVCGNSTMQHLFLGLNPEHLGKTPFTSITHSKVEENAETLQININPNGIVTFLPLLGGFVGADTTAVLLSTPSDDKKRLIIDLGTNGELAVGSNKEYKVASTACGPALEGAGIKFGMRGTDGAIEKLSIKEDKIEYKVIGDVKPLGFCGSGVIDLVAEMLKAGLLNFRGQILSDEKLSNHPLRDRCININNERVFVVVRENESKTGDMIYITQNDIRSIQLAKAAISTGCKLLIEENSYKEEEMDEILIAGAFGNYIDVENAQRIGLLPNIPGVPLKSIGNAAGTGCQMFLLSKEKQNECEIIAEKSNHFELASNPNFTNEYMKNAYFK